MSAVDAITLIISAIALLVSGGTLVLSRRDRRRDDYDRTLDRADQARRVEIDGEDRVPRRSDVLTGPEEVTYALYTEVTIRNLSDEPLTDVVMVYPSQVIVPKPMPTARAGRDPKFNPEYDTRPRASAPELTLPDGTQRRFTTDEISTLFLTLPKLRAGDTTTVKAWIGNPGASTPFEPELRFTAANGRRYRRVSDNSPGEF